MGDRAFRKPVVADVPAMVYHDFFIGVKVKMFRMRGFEQAEQPLGPQFILFFFVDTQCVVIAGTAKLIARIGIRRVHVAAGIDYERHPIKAELESELVIVLVIAETLGADDAVAHQQVVVGLT